MDELSPIEKLVVQAMEELGATKEEKKKTADDIAKKCNRPKSMVTNALVALSNKGAVKRVVREKASGYYVSSAQA
ncbi:MAG: transcriptional regulator [Candidatus Marsarchaeota archaeon]|jgi:predicted transcriptional regulator|nr:transcriptional regulator [Candidatus Marsarchaeota archaeon]